MTPTNQPDRAFPVLWPYRRVDIAKLTAAGCPRAVPWRFVADHHARCLSNHDQSPKTLAERGGLGALEMCAVVLDMRYRDAASLLVNDIGAVPMLQKLLAEYEANQPDRGVCRGGVL